MASKREYRERLRNYFYRRFVYGLTGPDGRLCYVGCATDVWARYLVHKCGTQPTPIGRYLGEQRKRGFTPRLVVLAVIWLDKKWRGCGDTERDWIEWARSNGHPLLNQQMPRRRVA